MAGNRSVTIVGSLRLQVVALERGRRVRAVAPAADDWELVFVFPPPHRLVFPDGSACRR